MMRLVLHVGQSGLAAMACCNVRTAGAAGGGLTFTMVSVENICAMQSYGTAFAITPVFFSCKLALAAAFHSENN